MIAGCWIGPSILMITWHASGAGGPISAPRGLLPERRPIMATVTFKESD
jgi:hypothetical protein